MMDGLSVLGESKIGRKTFKITHYFSDLFVETRNVFYVIPLRFYRYVKYPADLSKYSVLTVIDYKNELKVNHRDSDLTDESVKMFLGLLIPMKSVYDVHQV